MWCRRATDPIQAGRSDAPGGCLADGNLAPNYRMSHPVPATQKTVGARHGMAGPRPDCWHDREGGSSRGGLPHSNRTLDFGEVGRAPLQRGNGRQQPLARPKGEQDSRLMARGPCRQPHPHPRLGDVRRSCSACGASAEPPRPVSTSRCSGTHPCLEPLATHRPAPPPRPGRLFVTAGCLRLVGLQLLPASPRIGVPGRKSGSNARNYPACVTGDPEAVSLVGDMVISRGQVDSGGLPSPTPLRVRHSM